MEEDLLLVMESNRLTRAEERKSLRGRDVKTDPVQGLSCETEERLSGSR